MDRTDRDALRAFVALGWHRAAAARAGMVGRVLLYGLIVLIFWQLWQATPLNALTAPGWDAPTLFWYVIVTEWIAIGVSAPYQTVEIDIQTGRIAAGLLRPLPYGLATLADWAGETALRLIVLGAAGVALGAALTGTIPIGLASLPALVLSGALAAAIFLLFQLQLGYIAAWTGWAAPFYFVWQKLAFVLGGLLLPLGLYPEPLRAVAEATPFPSMLFAPGSLVVDPAAPAIAATLAVQLVWLAVMAGATALVDRAAAARFATHGV